MYSIDSNSYVTKIHKTEHPSHRPKSKSFNRSRSWLTIHSSAKRCGNEAQGAMSTFVCLRQQLHQTHGGRSSVRRLCILYSYILVQFLYIEIFRSCTNFNNKIFNENYIPSIYPSKLSMYALFTLEPINSKINNKNIRVAKCSLCGPIFLNKSRRKKNKL